MMRTGESASAQAARRIAQAAGGLAILIGGGHVLAWMAGAWARFDITSTIIMKTNAGVGLLACGIAVVLLASLHLSPLRRKIAIGCAAFAVLLGVATISEHLVGWDLGVDQLIANEPAGAAATTSPNRMGPPASISLVLIGSALLLLGRGQSSGRRALHEPLAAVVALLGLLSIIGYLYDVSALYHIPHFTGIAWPTALSFVLLAVGVLCTQPDRGMMARVTAEDAGGMIIRRLVGPTILLPLVIGWIRVVGERRGWFDAAMGTALMMLTFIASFSALLLFAGRRVSLSSAALRESEREAMAQDEALRRERALLVSVMSTTDVMLAYLDADFNFLWVNAAYAASCHKQPEELVGRNHFDLYPHAENETIFRRVRDTGESVFYKDKPFEYPDQPERGVTYWDWSLMPVRSDSGRVMGLVFSLRETTQDVTERRQAEKTLQEADRRKNEFLAVLSHELRNPLAAVRAALSVLEIAAPGREQATRARAVIDRQTNQLTRLVDDLLDVTRISRAKIQLQLEPVELSGLVQRTAEDHRSLFATRGIELDVDVPEETLWVDADQQRLAQAISNLLHNAAKFTERGGHTAIMVAREPGAEQAAIRVRDTGIGISPQLLPNLFQPFMQADHTIDRARGGLGLGLSLVKSLIDMHGGQVSAESDGVGCGALFTIRLPLRPAPPPVARVEGGDGAHQPRQVLIIEDNVDAAESLREALELAGHQVMVAYDGAQGVEEARRFKPEIILCDIGLPGMNGYEVAQALRRDQSLASVRLVALTGYALPEDLIRAREAGFDLHVAKPPSPEKLQEALSLVGPTPRPDA